MKRQNNIMAGKKIDVQGSHGQRYTILVSKNQKVIKIHRIKSAINFKANEQAQKELSIYAYAMYMYLIRHEQNRVWALSSKDVFEKTPLKEKTYIKAVQELIDKGYLTKGTIDLGCGDRKYKDEAYHLWETPSLRFEETPIGNEVFKESPPASEEEGKQFRSPLRGRRQLPSQRGNKY